MDGGEREGDRGKGGNGKWGRKEKRRTVFHGQNNEKKLENCDAT